MTPKRVKGPRAPGGPRRVLVIEDDVDAADTMRVVLEVLGHTVETANSGSEGLDKARAFAPDVVLCDIGLPDMDGYAVARAFRGDAALRRVFLVALTGQTPGASERRAAQAGFDRHLAKPPTIEMIEEVLADLPGSSR